VLKMDALMTGWKRLPLLTFWIIFLDFVFVGLVLLLVHRHLDDYFMNLVLPLCASYNVFLLDSLACDCGERL